MSLSSANNPRYATMAQRVEHRAELIPHIENWMASFAQDQDVLDELERHHVPAGPVLSPLDALDHPYFKSRDMVRWVDDPVTGPIPIPGFPFKFSAQPKLPELRAAAIGEHNRQILQERLGRSDSDVAALIDAGVIYERSTPDQPLSP